MHTTDNDIREVIRNGKQTAIALEQAFVQDDSSDGMLVRAAAQRLYDAACELDLLLYEYEKLAQNGDYTPGGNHEETRDTRTEGLSDNKPTDSSTASSDKPTHGRRRIPH